MPIVSKLLSLCAPLSGRLLDALLPSREAMAKSMDCAIPASFTQEQACWILELHWLCSRDRQRALQSLWDQAPGCCSKAQALCIEEMLSLEADDFYATLVDAMEDGAIREQLRAVAPVEYMA